MFFEPRPRSAAPAARPLKWNLLKMLAGWAASQAGQAGSVAEPGWLMSCSTRSPSKLSSYSLLVFIISLTFLPAHQLLSEVGRQRKTFSPRRRDREPIRAIYFAGEEEKLFEIIVWSPHHHKSLVKCSLY